MNDGTSDAISAAANNKDRWRWRSLFLLSFEVACLPTKGVVSLHLASPVQSGPVAGVYEEKSADHNRESGSERPENRVERRIYAVKLIL
ncbi:MAG: hypothetical protein ACPGLY_06695 [Rubripirellula sp.]